MYYCWSKDFPLSEHFIVLWAKCKFIVKEKIDVNFIVVISFPTNKKEIEPPCFYISYWYIKYPYIIKNYISYIFQSNLKIYQSSHYNRVNMYHKQVLAEINDNKIYYSDLNFAFNTEQH